MHLKDLHTLNEAGVLDGLIHPPVPAVAGNVICEVCRKARLLSARQQHKIKMGWAKNICRNCSTFGKRPPAKVVPQPPIPLWYYRREFATTTKDSDVWHWWETDAIVTISQGGFLK